MHKRYQNKEKHSKGKQGRAKQRRAKQRQLMAKTCGLDVWQDGSVFKRLGCWMGGSVAGCQLGIVHHHETILRNAEACGLDLEPEVA